MPRVVAHTNIYISALNFAGTADEVLALGRARVIEVFISPPIFEESTFNSPASIKSVVALLPKKREDLALEDVEITKPL